LSNHQQKEKTRVKFTGFNKEEVLITKRHDSNQTHDHLIVTINGEEVGYFHIGRNTIYFFHPLTGRPKQAVSLADLRGGD